MRVLNFIFFLVFCSAFAVAQDHPENEGLLAKANEIVNNNPEEAIKIGLHLLENSDKKNEKAAANMIIAESYLAQANYKQALSYAFKSKQTGSSSENIVKSNLLIAGILQTLRLERQAVDYLAEAKKLSSGDERFLADGKSFQEQALLQLENRNPQKALELLRLAKKSYAKIKNPRRDLLLNQLYVTLGRTFNNSAKYDSASVYIEKSLSYFKKPETRNLPGEANALTEKAKSYFQQKQHLKAIEMLNVAQKLAEKLQNNALLKDTNKQLALNYLALANRPKYHFYNQKFLNLSNDLETLESDATNTAFNLISKENENQALTEEQRYSSFFYISIGVFGIILCFGIGIFLKNQDREKRYKEIVVYLENSKKSFISDIPAKKDVPKNLFIPAETEQALLAKLKKFESSTRFTNKEMSLAVLSAQFDTNTKYLSEIINRHRQDNFNTYINKLRIGYIIEKMKSDSNYLNYKISYLAEESGFSAHSSFATVFKSITGIAPTTFIDFLKEENKAKKQSE